MIDWMPGVERIPTAAYTAKPINPLAVMSHIMQGYQSTMIRWAQERPAAVRASAHFTIGRDGRTVQHVSIREQAWHAGRLDPLGQPAWRLWSPGVNPSDISIGIEHEGFSVDPISYMYDYLYGVARPWPEPMVEASIRVHKWLFETLDLEPSEDTVIGHFMTAPLTRANDPGVAWPRARILAALQPPPVTNDLPLAVRAAIAGYNRFAPNKLDVFNIGVGPTGYREWLLRQKEK